MACLLCYLKGKLRGSGVCLRHKRHPREGKESSRSFLQLPGCSRCTRVHVAAGGSCVAAAICCWEARLASCYELFHVSEDTGVSACIVNIGECSPMIA